MNTEYKQEELDEIFSALSNRKRRDIISVLALYPATVKQLADQHDISLPAIHKHIRVLESSKLILRKKVGRTNFIALNRSSLNFVRDWVLQFRSDWGNDKETLANYIASMQK